MGSFMLEIILSDQTDQPLYMQLYIQIRNHIQKGFITNNTRLPSVRSLQLQLNISKTPIETAYQMLTSEGYVVSKPRSGLYVVNPYEIRSLSQNKKDSNHHMDLQQHIQTPILKKYLMDFDPSVVDKDMFPIRTWRKMLNGVSENFSGSICKYGDPQGEHSFRNILAEYLRNARGVVCSPDQIVIGSGILYSIGILTKLLTGIQSIAFEEPGFAPVREQFIANGFQVIPISIHEKGLSLEQLENSDAQTVYVTPSHQFPTGSVIPYAEREYLLNWANSRNAYIIEDDYDGEFRYLGKPIPSLQSLDRQGRVIYIGTFSKAFSPAIRLNYIVFPMEMISKMQTLHPLLFSPSLIDQLAMQAFIEQGHWYRHIRRMRNTYRKKHHLLIELIHTHFADRVEITGHSAGLHIQVTVKTRQTVENLVKLAADHGVRIYDFHNMWMNQNQFGFPKIYLGFGGISEKDIETGILLLKKAWSCILD
jgi:GntR family transcriptional regulator/MocR family aminotransferase